MTAEPSKQRSAWYRAAKKVYFFVAGSPTSRNILSFKYLSTYMFHKDLKKVLAASEGDILDFGCGTKPYKSWFKKTGAYVGVDMYEHPAVDIVLRDKTIPTEQTFDVALASQVFEHTDSLNYLGEIHRLLNRGGKLIISVPFLYHIHEEHDHRRFTKQGLVKSLAEYGFSSEEIYIQGGVGSTTVTTILYFFDALMRNHAPRYLQILCLPLIVFWLLIIVPVLNIIGYLCDRLDSTRRFYNNILIVAHKHD